MDAELLGGEQRVGVRTDPVERHVSEIEQTSPAKDDVEPERKQHVQNSVEGDAPDVAAVVNDRQRGEGGDEERQPGPPRDGTQPVLDRA